MSIFSTLKVVKFVAIKGGWPGQKKCDSILVNFDQSATSSFYKPTTKLFPVSIKQVEH